MGRYEIKKITKQKRKEQLVMTLLRELPAPDLRELAAAVHLSGTVQREL